MSDSDSYCTDCKRYTEVVFDRSAGDTVCSECGLVLESRSIDETSEWRTFADDSGDDPNRVGIPVNPLLEDAALSTGISKGGTKGSNVDASLTRLKCWVGDPDRVLYNGFSTISNMADRLSLVKTIKDRAGEIFKKLEDQKCTRGRKLEALVAACIYIACRQESKPRTLKEISCSAGGATMREISRAKGYIVKQLKFEMGESMEMGTVHARDYLRRFCSNLGMSNIEVRVVQETVKKAGDFDIRRSPISIAAVIIFMITQLSESKKPLRDVSIATTVAEGTIRQAYKDIYPFAAKIIPEWYAKERDLNNLHITTTTSTKPPTLYT
ncbi:hypothetical protein ACJIZ3_025865 [Penstemon smallii]|uniref:TFIIB-type domain-containing protein n=1 Tax=Penstemon smallii TaxID=265156 RepID=A0ABD3TVR3_9LAMI